MLTHIWPSPSSDSDPLNPQFAEFFTHPWMRICFLSSLQVHTIVLLSLSLKSLHATPYTNCRGRSMAGLQRSSQTFRRSGSSGLVWDERLTSQDDDQSGPEDADAATDLKELRHSRSVGSVGLQPQPQPQPQRRRSDDSGQGFRTRRVAPALDPPSPKVPGCIFCGIFRKAGASEPKSKPRRY